MNKVAGTFNGTGADLYLCLGFIPDSLKLFNYETSNDYQIEWDQNMVRSTEFVEGRQIHTGTTYEQITALTKGNGILQYLGGVTLDVTSAGTTTYAEGVYLKPDNRDYRYLAGDTSPHGLGDAVGYKIDTWTLDTLANYTGKFNADATGTYIGEGSIIQVDGIRATIVALTAGQGIADDEVTLSYPLPSGKIEHISGMYSTRPMVAGEVTKEGVLISNTTVNVNDALIGFTAEKWDW